MTTASKEKWAKAEGAMMAELRPVLMLLKADYEAASKIHIPNWKGGPNAGILAELVRMGWRKSEANMNRNDQNGGTTPLELALAWGFVGIPLLWGIYGTLVNAMKLSPVETSSTVSRRPRQVGRVGEACFGSTGSLQSRLRLQPSHPWTPPS